MFSEFLRIAKWTLRLTDIIPCLSELHSQMVAQGGYSNKSS